MQVSDRESKRSSNEGCSLFMPFKIHIIQNMQPGANLQKKLNSETVAAKKQIPRNFSFIFAPSGQHQCQQTRDSNGDNGFKVPKSRTNEKKIMIPFHGRVG